MKLKDKSVNKKNLKISTLFICVLAVLIVLLVLIFVKWYHGESMIKTKKIITEEISYDNYIYKIRYDFGAEVYIYLLPNNIIKTVEKQEIFDIAKDCKCLKSTGKYSYTEEEINFSSISKTRVVNVFDELYKVSGKREFNADDIELNTYQKRILSAIVLNDEDKITLEDNINYEEVKKEIKGNNSFRIENKMYILKNNTKNKLVNTIANYLNKKAKKDFETLNNDCEDLVDGITENLGVILKLNLEYAGPYSLSFSYTAEGQIGTTAYYDKKGYTFYYTGQIHEFDMNGWKESYYQKALNEFENSELYKNNKNQLVENWENILYDNMYKTGNWYLKDSKLQFLIPADLLGFDEATSRIVVIDVDVDEEF